jgi:hypothetical protein
MSKQAKSADMSGLYPAAIRASITKLDPRALWRNPVMFVTAVVAAMTTVLGLRDFVTGVAGAGTSLHIAAWLWLCVIFANFAEALAEGRGKARADTLRATKSETKVRVLADASAGASGKAAKLRTAARRCGSSAQRGGRRAITASTSFANPAAACGRMFSDSFAGIAPQSAPGFVVAQLVGAFIGWGLYETLRGRHASAPTSASAASSH